MSKYTIELNRLLESGFNLEMTGYPIFDEGYRGALNSKIIDHFRFREIGFETPAMFRYYINMTLNEVMPLYNQYYLSALLTVDPLKTKDLTRTYTKEQTGESTQAGNVASEGTMTSEGTGKVDNTADLLNVESDTPAQMLTVGNIKGNIYASKANRQNNISGDKSETTANSHGLNTAENESAGTIHNLDTYTERLFGFDGVNTQSKMLAEFRKTFLNIDMMVISELNSCFMGVF